MLRLFSVGLMIGAALFFTNVNAAGEDAPVVTAPPISPAVAMGLFVKKQYAEQKEGFIASVDQVICARAVRDKDGKMTGDLLVSNGTGTVIEKDTVLTANHVANNMDVCSFGGEIAESVLYADPTEDVFVMKVPTGDKGAFVAGCSGFKTGEHYRAMGFAGGLRPMLMSSLKATARFEDFPAKDEYPFPSPHLRVFDGFVITGMSGGPIFDKEGVIVGIVTASMDGEASNRDLSDTGLCKPAKKP